MQIGVGEVVFDEFEPVTACWNDEVAMEWIGS